MVYIIQMERTGRGLLNIEQLYKWYFITFKNDYISTCSAISGNFNKI